MDKQKVFNWVWKNQLHTQKQKGRDWDSYNLTKKCHLVQYESRGKNGPDQRQSILLRPNWQYIFTPALSQNGFNVAYKDIWDKWREHKRCENKKENNGKNTEWIIAKKYTL